MKKERTKKESNKKKKKKKRQERCRDIIENKKDQKGKKIKSKNDVRI